MALSFTGLAQETILLEGVYKGKDLYVKNPFAPDGVGFCAYQVRVNGLVSSDEVNSSAFIIDLSLFELEKGDPVEVSIEHKKGCKPEFINPVAIYPEPSFEVVSMDLTEDGLLRWTTRSEDGALMYRVEQFKWNKWVQVGEVMGIGDSKLNQYSFQGDLHFGENQFRVSQGIARGGRKISEPVKVISNRPGKIELISERIRDEIEFSGPTAYELFNGYGDLVLKGYGKVIDLRRVEKGNYYLNYANISSWEFQKR